MSLDLEVKSVISSFIVVIDCRASNSFGGFQMGKEGKN